MACPERRREKKYLYSVKAWTQPAVIAVAANEQMFFFFLSWELLPVDCRKNKLWSLENNVDQNLILQQKHTNTI